MIRSHLASTAVAGALALACATANLESQDAVTGRLPRPPMTLVYAFAVDKSEVQVDQWGLNSAGSGASDAQRQQVARTISASFRDALVKDLEKRGIRAQAATRGTPRPQNAVMLQGVFVSLQEGDDAKRTVIGFGQGASSLEARIRAYQESPGGPRYLGMGTVTAKGSRKPGVAVSGVSAAATGSVVGLAIKGAEKVGSQTGLDEPLPNELKEGVQADVVRAAGKVGDLIAEKYRERGWL